MTQQNNRKYRRLCNQAISGNPNIMLDTLLALDRAVVEFSMDIYNLPAGERFAMRDHNQRLHDTVRENLPRYHQQSQLGNSGE